MKLNDFNSQSIANSNINSIQQNSIETSTTKTTTATSTSKTKTKKSGSGVPTRHILAVLNPIAESYSSHSSHSSHSSVANYKSQRNRNKLLSKCVRNIITASFAFLFFDILFLVFSIYNYLFTHTHTHLFIFLWILHIILITIDEGINIICLHLQHKYSTKFYVKRCNKMHQFVIHLFVKDENNAPIITGTNERVSVPSRTGNTTDGQGLSIAELEPLHTINDSTTVDESGINHTETTLSRPKLRNNSVTPLNESNTFGNNYVPSHTS